MTLFVLPQNKLNLLRWFWRVQSFYCQESLLFLCVVYRNTLYLTLLCTTIS